MKLDAAARENISKTLKRRKGIRTNPGIAERNPLLDMQMICRHCDTFFRSRGLPVTEAGFGEFFQH